MSETSPVPHGDYPPCGDTLRYDGHGYPTVKIGNCCWLAENLRNTHYADGTPIPNTSFYSNDSALLAEYGRLYTWDAVVRAGADGQPSLTGSGRLQGICPDGWTVPSAGDYMQLVEAAGGAGGLKSHAAARYWLGIGDGEETHAGFNALPGGARDEARNGWYGLLGEGWFWTSGRPGATCAPVGCELGYYCPDLLLKDAPRQSGFSVRCIVKPEKKTITVGDVIFDMVLVEGDTFWMGAQHEDPDGLNYDTLAFADEAPVHQVVLSDFLIGETEVTQALWHEVTGLSPITNPNISWREDIGLGDDYPAYFVSWNEIMGEGGFLEKLNAMAAPQLNGMKFDLPTEAQWEFAARGGKLSNHYYYSGSNDPEKVSWYWGLGKTHPVKQKLPNELGLYDMSGNVWEWVKDLVLEYSGELQTDPCVETSVYPWPVGRGGSWREYDWESRVSLRYWFVKKGHYDSHGLRLVLHPD